jgi:hypothetical protein
MKRAVSIAILLALLTVVVPVAGWGQQVQANQYIITAPPVSPLAGVSGRATGTLGGTTLYYWVVARYPAGVSIQTGPAVVRQTQGIAGLGANPVILNWTAAAGATGYDVIRLTTAQWPPTSTCANCVVSSNQAGITFTDNTGASVVTWPTAGTVFSSPAILRAVVNNRDDNYPYIMWNGEYHIVPVRSTNAYAYLYGIGGLMTGGAAQKTYALGITVTRPDTAIATGDSNDALIKGAYSNYAKNDASFIIRGINTVVTNRSPGTLGMLDNLISVANRSGATSPIVNGLTVNAENYGVNATQHSGVDVGLKNEAAKATLEFGYRVRNLNNSIAGPSDAAFLVGEPSLANTGWNFILDANGVKSPTHAFARLQNGAVVYYGTQVTRDTVRSEVGTAGTIGSLYSSSGGKLYLKVANANGTTDWQLVTATAAD